MPAAVVVAARPLPPLGVAVTVTPARAVVPPAVTVPLMVPVP